MAQPNVNNANANGNMMVLKGFDGLLSQLKSMPLGQMPQGPPTTIPGISTPLATYPGENVNILARILGMGGKGSNFGVNAMNNIGPDNRY